MLDHVKESVEKDINIVKKKINEIRTKYLDKKGQTYPKSEDAEIYSYSKTEVEQENFNPCKFCGESRGKKHFVKETSSENGKDKGKMVCYCENCGECVEYDWDNTKALESH